MRTEGISHLAILHGKYVRVTLEKFLRLVAATGLETVLGEDMHGGDFLDN
jgi:hypothetical protein